MAGIAKTTKKVKKAKKHGVKAGQKSLVRPSQKKSVKNGRAQPKPKVVAKKKLVEQAALAPIFVDEPIDDTDYTVELDNKLDEEGFFYEKTPITDFLAEEEEEFELEYNDEDDTRL
jgi:hypothetical protein